MIDNFNADIIDQNTGSCSIYQANTYDLSRRRLSVIDNFNADIIDQDTIPSDIIYYQG